MFFNRSYFKFFFLHTYQNSHIFDFVLKALKSFITLVCGKYHKFNSASLKCFLLDTPYFCIFSQSASTFTTATVSITRCIKIYIIFLITHLKDCRLYWPLHTFFTIFKYYLYINFIFLHFYSSRLYSFPKILQFYILISDRLYLIFYL